MENNEWKAFNLNGYIRVKIKDKGYQYLADENNQWSLIHPNIISVKDANYYRNKEDLEGYTKMQAHEFITKFGSLKESLDRYVDINILIYNK